MEFLGEYWTLLQNLLDLPGKRFPLFGIVAGQRQPVGRLAKLNLY